LDNLPILTLLTFSPLLGILVLLFIPKQRGQWIKIIAITATLIPLLLAGWLYVDFNHQSADMQYAEEVEWITVPLNQDIRELSQFSAYFYEFKYNMGVDGLSLPLVFLTALISFMAALASVYIKKRWKTFYILFLLLQIGMFGVFLSKDLFLFFLFFEVTLIPMFFLVGIWGYRDREKAANKFLIYNGIGSAIMLIAFLILVNTAGFGLTELPNGQAELSYSGDLSVISNNLNNPEAFANLDETMYPDNPFYVSGAMKWTLFIMLLVAFGIKLPIFPFHTWMLKVHTEAPPAIVMIHSGILLKMGAYGLIRYGVLLFPEQAKAWAVVLAVLGLINILYGAILAFVQKDFKLVLAYSSISHMGIVLLGIAAFNQMGLQGAVIHLVSHGLISALMFLIVGIIYERTSTTMMDKLGGLSKSTPFIAGILLIAGMASLGLPGLSGFVSELLTFIGLFDTMPIITAIGTLGIILTAVYVLRAVLKINFGPAPETYGSIKDARLIEVVPMITLVAFILLIGVYPKVLSEPIQQTIQILVTKMGG
jgi:NADH-quinone oxidoreductase subunit M